MVTLFLFFLALVQTAFSKICVVSLITGDKFKLYQDALVDNKLNYCNIHGYTCFVHTNTVVPPTRPLAWQKIDAIQLAMDKNCDIILWIDGDAIIMKSDIKIQDPIKDIALGRNGDGINSGVMIIKNTLWSKQYFKQVSGMHEFDHHHWWEQAAMMKLDKNIHIRRHIKSISLDIYNSNKITHDTFIYHPWLCNSWYGDLKCEDLWKIAFSKLDKEN